MLGVVVAAAALLLVACKEDEPQPVAVVTATGDGEVDLAAVATTLEGRLEAVGQAGSVDVVDESVEVSLLGEAPDEAGLDLLLTTPAQLAVRPVTRLAAPAECGGGGGSAATPAGGEVVTERGPGGEALGCYEVGPPIVTNSGIESAEALEFTPEQWSVRLVLTPEGLADFNEMAGYCVARALACPYGRVAVVVDGLVVTAPVLQQPTFTPDQLQLTSEQLDATSAPALAAFLNGGRLPEGLELDLVDGT